jgi:hypothetical protein
VDKAALLGMTVPTEEYEIPGVGAIVLRGLTRLELAHVLSLEGKMLKQEQASLSLAMVDPPMTEQDVAEWQKSSPGGLINDIATVINRLSGLGKGAAKSRVPADGDEPNG